jgi:G3E family GTPase
MDHRIPVTLLTGFLGSGKTTLLNKLLTNQGMKDTAVIINELGEAGLDHILAQNVESSYVADNTVLLQSGCLCEPVIESVYRLDAVVVTIDAAYGAEQIDTHAEARKQAAVADVLLITKTDLVSPEQVDALKEKLIALNPGATQHKILHGEIDSTFIIDVGLFDPTGKQAEPQRWLRAPVKSAKPRGMLPQKPHDDDITSFTVTMPKPLNWADLKPRILWLCQTYGEHLLRLKGIIHAEDQPAPLAIHAVHFTPYPPTLLEGWDEDEPISRIVLIGKGLDELAIRKALMQV